MAREGPFEEVDSAAPARSASAPVERDASSWLERRLGPYEPIVEIARGGMGAVFAARVHEGPSAGRVIALKLLRADLTGSHQRAFVREARVTSRLQHPNVVRTLDAGEVAGEVYLAMELVVGVTLAQLLARLLDRELVADPWAAAFIAARAARGLHAAHELRGDDGAPLSLVHRDVSPQNILIDFDARVLVADFGIAKFAHDGTTTEDGTLKGKFAYMSPEQIRAEPLDRRADVFALGAVLYEALTGERAFNGRGPADIVAQVLHGDPRDPRALRPNVPASIATVVLRSLATDREDRYASAADVARALDAALAHAPHPPEALVTATLAAHFATERGRFERLVQQGAPPVAAAAATARPIVDAATDVTLTMKADPRASDATLTSAAPSWAPSPSAQAVSASPSIPVATGPSTVARWVAAMRVERAPVPTPRPSGSTLTSAARPDVLAAPASASASAPASVDVPESRWPLRAGILVGLAVAATLVVVLLTSGPSRKPNEHADAAGSGTASSGAASKPDGSTDGAPAARPAPVVIATADASGTKPDARSAAPPDGPAPGTTPQRVAVPPRPPGDPAARPPPPRPSASAGGVFRDW